MKQTYLKNVVQLSLDWKKCTGCGRCTEICPHGVFALAGGKAVIADKDACMECGACQKNCPAKAIQVNPGVGCAAAIIGSLFKKNGVPECSCGQDGGTCCG